MNGQSCTNKDHLHTNKQKKQKQAIFTVLGHVVEAQHLPKTLPT
jgi:hypothetical protein